MEETFHYLLMANQALVHKRLLASLKDTGLTIGQPKVLEYLSEHDGSNQTEIARGCHIEAASLTSVLNRMEEKGMVQRKMLHGNRRTYHIFLTPFGVEQQEHVERAFAELEEQALSGFTPEERRQGIQMMQAIFAHLQKEKLHE